MTETEAERIAAAIHELRPDWPRTSLLTFIRRNLLGKPRRDALVALAWVAADAKTDKPARVLEAGPWWRAALIEDGSTPAGDRGPWCRDCGQGPTALVHRNGDHVFAEKPPKADPARKAELLEAARADMAAHPGPAVVEAAPVGETCTTGGCIRGAGHTGSHLAAPATEPERETA